MFSQSFGRHGLLALALALAELPARLGPRVLVCHSGGTIDGINTAICLFDESTTRLAGLKGIIPPEAMLKSTDSNDLSQLSWYTTAEGSRIGEINTQGDQAGGVIVAWVVIGGADGFVVNPKQFYCEQPVFAEPHTGWPSSNRWRPSRLRRS